MKNKTSYDVFPFLLFSISLIFLTSLISKGAFSSDNMFLVTTAQKILAEHKMHYLQASGLPFTAISGAAFLFLASIIKFNNPVLTINFMSIAYASGSIALTYLITKKEFDRLFAVLVACATLTHPVFFADSVFGNSHTIGLFFLLLSYYLLRKQTTGFILLAGSSLGLAAAARIQDIPLLMPLIGILMFDLFRKKEINASKLFLFTSVSLIIVGIFYLPLYLEQKSLKEFLTFFQNYQLHSRFKEISLSRFFSHFSFLTAYGQPISYILLITGSIAMYKFNKKAFCVLLLWLLSFFLTYSWIIGARPRYFYMSVIPYSIFITFPLYKLLNLNRRLTTITIGLFSILIYFYVGFYYPILKTRHNYDHIGDFYRWAGKMTPENSIIIEWDNCVFVNTESLRECIKPPALEDQNIPVEYLEKIDQYLKHGRPVYITDTALLRDFQNRLLYGKFLAHYNMMIIGKHITEDWHGDSLIQDISQNQLYRLIPKNNEAKNL